MTQSVRVGAGSKARHPVKGRRLAAVTLCLASLAVGVAWGLLSVHYPPIPTPFSVFQRPFGGSRQVNVLVLGVDNVKRTGGLSDTIIVASFDFENERIAAMSIPRDFRVQIPGYGYNKINAAYSLGGLELSIETVERLMQAAGGRTRRIDHHMACSFQGFKRTVDAMGGVDIDVEKRMRYRDRSQGLYINLRPGLQRLNGEQALGYVRYRHTDSDLHRIVRQQKFLREAARQALQPARIARLPVVLATVVKNVETDMTAKDLHTIRKLVEKVGADNVEMVQLPGVPAMDDGVSYLDPQWSVISRLLAYVVDNQGPRVEVLNGTSQEGLGRRCADRLLASGYEVTVIANATYMHDSSRVIDHVGWPKQAQRIARLLNCGRVSTDGKPSRWADITVIVGRDYARAAQ